MEDLEFVEEKKNFKRTKTHEDILEMLKEIDSLEQQFETPTAPQEYPPLEIIPETPDSSEKLTQPTKIEPLSPEKVIEKESPKKLKIKTTHAHIFSLKIRRKNNIEKPDVQVTHKRIFHRRLKKGKQLKLDISETEAPMQQPQVDIKRQSTFILSINEAGDLVGFPIPKPKPQRPERSKRRLPFKRKKTTTEEPEPEGGKKHRIRLPLKRKKGKAGEAETPSNEAEQPKTKKKGRFSRKAKKE